jgi:hypothetical protein
MDLTLDLGGQFIPTIHDHCHLHLLLIISPYKT